MEKKYKWDLCTAKERKWRGTVRGKEVCIKGKRGEVRLFSFQKNESP